jgi:hypothetical protein
MAVCPRCHQSVDDIRLGVRLTPLKASLFDRIKAAGDIGISTTEIIQAVYRDRSPIKETAIKSHVNQINDLLAGTEWRIRSDRRRWFLHRDGGKADA